MFQVSKWNWKRVAAKLLLIPVLAGGAVAVVNGQFGKGTGAGAPANMPTGTAQPQGRAPQPTAGDPKQLLKDGRRALKEGRFAEAQDLAQAAESSNPGGKWGLFDDTPNALRKDIRAAMDKANKAKSEQLVKEAKKLAGQPAGSEAERAYNLDTAIQMAREADRLHGPYSSWSMGDRADKLVKELEGARAKLKVASAPKPVQPGATAGNQPNRTPPGTPYGQASRTPPGMQPGPQGGVRPAAGTDNRKVAANKLMAEAKALAQQGHFGAAKAKYIEADRLGAQFAPNEYSPGFGLQELNALGAAAVDRYIRDAQAFTAQRDFAKADAALNAASNVASTLGLFPRPVAEAKAMLWTASAGKFGTPSPSGMAAAGGPEHLIPAGTPGHTPPPLPPGHQTVYGGSGKPVGGTLTARQLLDQAKTEFTAGQFDTAETLARQAFNLGAKEEAHGLLNSIDVERLKMKQIAAARALDNARTAAAQKDYKQAFGVLVLIEPRLLSDEANKAREELLTQCKAELDKMGPLVQAGGSQPGNTIPPPDMGLPTPGGATQPTPGSKNPPGVATVGPDNPAAQADSLKKVQVQKLRAEGLTVQSNAQAAFGRGETDLAMQMLVDYSNRVRASGLDPSSIALLLRPIEYRLDTFRMMKGQADSIARQNKERKDAKDLIAGRGIAEEERKASVAALVRQYNMLIQKKDFAGAERVALQAKQLDPDDPAVTGLYEMAKMRYRVQKAEEDKANREKFVYEGLGDADRFGAIVTDKNPVSVNLERMELYKKRGSGDFFQKTRTPAEYEIELKMEKPISIEFRQTPLDQAIKNLQTLTGLPLVIDYTGLSKEGLSEVQPITFEPGPAPMSTKNVLACVLEQAGLSYVIENDAVKITTMKKAKGRMYTKVFSVADLVTPVPNFALPDYANYDKILSRQLAGPLGLQGPAPTGRGTLGGGTQASRLPGELATSPGIHTPGGRLDTNPLAASANVTTPTNTQHEQLIRLITGLVRAHTWEGQGGPGKIEFYDIGSALVVNQTADVISEIVDLLEALRRLQDLSLTIEVRIVSLSEAFFERMGLDFQMNIKTHTANFEPQLTSGTFRPAPFVNDINAKGVTIGLTPAGTFTPDLDVPIRQNSFGRAIPEFGGYPNTTGQNGGIALGLAFLNDIQVFTFLEMAQGDRRSNVMQAPKITLFNGQTASLGVNDSQFFVLNVGAQVTEQGVIYFPQNQPIPIGVNLTIQGVVSADRRFVRISPNLNLTAATFTTVPLFPFTTIVTPVFEGGSQGQPIPFTQFLQQPNFQSVNVQTTVVCPDGGTVVLGGLKTVSENRNEFGPPFLSKIPYLSRLFRNVGVGRETRHVMLLITPRIIITSEEEIIQTEGVIPGAAPR